MPKANERTSAESKSFILEIIEVISSVISAVWGIVEAFEERIGDRKSVV